MCMLCNTLKDNKRVYLKKKIYNEFEKKIYKSFKYR